MEKLLRAHNYCSFNIYSQLYTKTLKDLKKATKKLWERVQEKQERPKAIEALNSIMNYSVHFLFGMKNFTGDEPGEQPFTTVEYETLEKLVKETKVRRQIVS